MDTTSLARIAIIIVGLATSFTALGVAVHYYLHRFVRRTSAPPAIDDSRFSRLEQSVEAIAIEVERISEGQRFLTRLQTASQHEPFDAMRVLRPERAITPVA